MPTTPCLPGLFGLLLLMLYFLPKHLNLYYICAPRRARRHAQRYGWKARQPAVRGPPAGRAPAGVAGRPCNYKVPPAGRARLLTLKVQ